MCYLDAGNVDEKTDKALKMVVPVSGLESPTY